ncbi:hypothetical protein [Acinetobacter brisouii]|uniref:hypothetical protein n=1 Tax=Acinetobacter brisouii TaxID=396323 RepID=UPI00124E64FF|nr:hypothetical protein [Acinetobacter brisouii]
MQTAQFKQILSHNAFDVDQKFFAQTEAERFGLTPFLKVWASCGGEDGFVSEFYQNKNSEVIYSTDLCGATLFFKLEITGEKTALVHQVGISASTGESVFGFCAVEMCKFSEHDYDNGWHFGFGAFDSFLNAFSIEAQATGATDSTSAILEFYKRNELDEYDCNVSRYFPHLFKFYGTVDGTYHPSEANNNKVIGEITL